METEVNDDEEGSVSSSSNSETTSSDSESSSSDSNQSEVATGGVSYSDPVNNNEESERANKIQKINKSVNSVDEVENSTNNSTVSIKENSRSSTIPNPYAKSKGNKSSRPNISEDDTEGARMKKKAKLEARNENAKAKRLANARRSERIKQANPSTEDSKSIQDDELGETENPVYDDVDTSRPLIPPDYSANNGRPRSYNHRSGYISLPYNKKVGKKRSCMQDTVINVASLLGMDIEHEVNERIPAYELLDTMINDVIYDEFVSKYLHFQMITYCHQDGGNEVFTFTELLRIGGKYIIVCDVIKTKKLTEKHAFVLNADYRNEKLRLRGAIIDNQLHTKLIGIEEKDLVDKTSMRNICCKLFGGRTNFKFCWSVTKKRN